MAEETKSRLESILKELSRSPGYRRLKEMVKNGPHPDPELLADYVSGELDDYRSNEILEHIAVCRPCLREVTEIAAFCEDFDREFERDLEKQLLPDPSSIFTEMFPAPLTLLGPEQPGPTDMGSKYVHFDVALTGSKVFHVGELREIQMWNESEGHLWLFHYIPGTASLELLFPDLPDTNTFLPCKSKKRLNFAVRGPTGNHYLHAVLTRVQLVDHSEVDFEDPLKVQNAMARFLRRSQGLTDKDWWSAWYEFVVSE